MMHAKKLFWKNWIVLLLGLCVLLLPFLGFPARIDNWIFGSLGLLIVIFAFLVGRGLSYAASLPPVLPPLQSAPPRPAPVPRRKERMRINPVSVPVGSSVAAPLPDATLDSTEPLPDTLSSSVTPE
ncbi:MAG: hypothetical protein A2542_01800 [Parcubacteria group bacterium RIFOXYD2_FULL_52_8]|nr:MAG: hypothetical protein A2542_01800 [Parcubacteria group bacterium RIFOXYD2_FULL_52_8]